MAPGADAVWVRVASWIFAAFLALNTLSNLASKSRIERAVMTPATLILVICFVIISLS